MYMIMYIYYIILYRVKYDSLIKESKFVNPECRCGMIKLKHREISCLSRTVKIFIFKI